MVKLILTINEKTTLNLKDIRAIGTDISIQEIRKNATKAEIKVSNILKERLKVNDKLQFESNSKKSKEELKEELIELLKGI